MVIAREQFVAKLAAAGVPVGLFAQDELNGVVFGALSPAFISHAWGSFLDLLQADPAAQLTEVRPNPAGGLGRRVPRYINPGGVCRHWAFAWFGFLMLCLMKQAAANPKQDHDGYAVAVFNYTALPRPDDLMRSGRHTRILFVDETTGELAAFEEGDGEPEPLTPEEYASITFLVAI